ncbi:MAG: leucine-rich repeat domain-containing protein [Limisphaerales bacterium]
MKALYQRWVVVLLALWALSAAAQPDSDFAIIGNNGQVTIEGYVGPVGPVVIPPTIYGWTVVAIDDYAFNGFYSPPNVTSITIPDTVTRIGYRSFWECTTLTNVAMGNGVISMGDEEFEDCNGLTSVSLSTNLANIGAWAFYPCGGLTTITIPNSVTNIGDDAFYSCSGLTNVVMGTNVTSIGLGAFGLCSGLTNVTLPNSLVTLGGGAFQSCSGLIRITIPNNVTSIGQDAFMGCSGLIGATIGTNVSSIGDFAFRDCTSLSGVMIPNSVTSVGMDAFYNCTSVTNLTIGTNVTSMASWAFTYCNPTSLTIPGSVTNIGDYALGGMSNLKAIYFTGNAPTNLGVGILQGDPVTVYYLPQTTGWGSTFAGYPAVLWNPRAQTGDGSFGLRTNRFGFDISGTANIPIAVVASTNPAGGPWTVLQSCTLTNGLIYFSDPQWANYRARFYRFRSP